MLVALTLTIGPAAKIRPVAIDAMLKAMVGLNFICIDSTSHLLLTAVTAITTETEPKNADHDASRSNRDYPLPYCVSIWFFGLAQHHSRMIPVFHGGKQ